MAVIINFKCEEQSRSSRHPTDVNCKYFVLERDGYKLLQLNTYGSTEREIPDKVSQTIQLDSTAARQLWEIIGKEFNLK